jgi:hypothetical protein
MDKLTVETPAQWLIAQKLKLNQIIPPIYIKETVVYEFYKWSHRKAKFEGFAIGLAFAVAVVVTLKLIG